MDYVNANYPHLQIGNLYKFHNTLTNSGTFDEAITGNDVMVKNGSIVLFIDLEHGIYEDTLYFLYNNRKIFMNSGVKKENNYNFFFTEIEDEVY